MVWALFSRNKAYQPLNTGSKRLIPNVFVLNIEDVMALAKRKGIFAPTAEIYGGAAGLYDYGHVGAAIKRRFESVWMAYFVERMENYHMIDGSTVLPEKP